MRLVFDFKKERRAQFVAVGNQLVVDVDLLADLVEIADSFRAQHFLNLKCHRIAVFEYQRHPIAERNAPPLLLIDDIFTEFVAHLFVGGKSEDVVENDLLHDPETVGSPNLFKPARRRGSTRRMDPSAGFRAMDNQLPRVSSPLENLPAWDFSALAKV